MSVRGMSVKPPYLIFRFTDYFWKKSGRQEGIIIIIKKSDILKFFVLLYRFCLLKIRSGGEKQKNIIKLHYFSKLKTIKSKSIQYLVLNNVGFMLGIHVFDSPIW